MLQKFKKKYIGNRAFYKMLFGIAVPIMVQNGISNFVSLLDNIMVGRLGTEQMSGVAIVNQLVFVFFLFMFGGLSGVGIFTAQYFGKGDDEGIRITFRYKLWIGLFVVVATAVIFTCYGENLIQLYLNGSTDGGDLEATLQYGLTYIHLIVFMLPLFYIEMVYTSTLRECGETVMPMKAGILAVLINLVFNYLLIFGKFGFPKLGVVGAAVATLIARTIEMIYVLIWSYRNSNKHTYLKGIYRTLRVPLDQVKKFLITGMPLLLNEGLWSIGVAMLAQAYSLRGLEVVAGNNIASTINNMFNIVFIAMGDAVAIIVGQYLGAGDMRKARDADNKIIAFAMMSSVVIGAIMFIFSPLFPELYKTSDAAKLIATHFIMVQSVMMVKDAFLHTSYFTIRAGGKTIITFIFDSVFMLVVSVPLANFLCRYTNLGVSTCFFLVHFADMLKCVLGFYLVYKGIWMKNIVKDVNC